MNDEDACFGWHLAAEGMAAEGMAAEGLAQQFRQLGVGLWLRQKMPFVLIQRLPACVGRQRGLQVVSVL